MRAMTTAIRNRSAFRLVPTTATSALSLPGLVQTKLLSPSHGRPMHTAATTGDAAQPSSDGIRWVYEHPCRMLKLKRGTKRKGSGKPTDVIPEVELTVDYSGLPKAELEEIEDHMAEDAGSVLRHSLLLRAESQPGYKLPRMASLSILLCNDQHIRALNLQHRNKDEPTDVLSFEMQDEMDFKVGG